MEINPPKSPPLFHPH